MIDFSQFLTYDQAATAYRCSRSTIIRAVNAGIVVSRRIGRNVWLEIHSLDEWFNNSGNVSQRKMAEAKARANGRKS